MQSIFTEHAKLESYKPGPQGPNALAHKDIVDRNPINPKGRFSTVQKLTLTARIMARQRKLPAPNQYSIDLKHAKPREGTGYFGPRQKSRNVSFTEEAKA